MPRSMPAFVAPLGATCNRARYKHDAPLERAGYKVKGYKHRAPPEHFRATD